MDCVTKIIPYTIPEGSEIGVESMSITYSQEIDNEARNGDYDCNTITLHTEPGYSATKEEALEDGCYYYVMETKRWAFDDIDEIITLLTDFKERLLKKGK
jgi:hypothetical protein